MTIASRWGRSETVDTTLGTAVALARTVFIALLGAAFFGVDFFVRGDGVLLGWRLVSP